MDTLDLIPTGKKKAGPPEIIGDKIREQTTRFAKDFKTSWVGLGQSLYSIWKDKMYLYWGFQKFEDYTERELGLKKQLAIKLLKTYYFLEQEEPAYLKEEYAESREAIQVPSYEAVDVLRLAKRKKELTRADYVKLRKDIFEEGREASVLRKDLTALIRERKGIDPDEERENRNAMAIKRLIYAITSFTKDAEAVKLIPHKLVKEAQDLREKLEAEVS